ncbi:hypothetical protein OROMI_034041 [Orobanche minor]
MSSPASEMEQDIFDRFGKGAYKSFYTCTARYTLQIICAYALMEKESKKEAFRKYLESSGVLDALTKVLVALYEQNDKPSSAIEFVQQKLGGQPLAEYEKLQADFSDLQMRYNELSAVHQEKCQEVRLMEYEGLKKCHVQASPKETPNEQTPNEGL